MTQEEKEKILAKKGIKVGKLMTVKTFLSKIKGMKIIVFVKLECFNGYGKIDRKWLEGEYESHHMVRFTYVLQSRNIIHVQLFS